MVSDYGQPAIPAALKALKAKLNKVLCFIFVSGLLLQKRFFFPQTHFHSVRQSVESFYRDKSTPLFVCLFSGCYIRPSRPTGRKEQMKHLNHICTHQVYMEGAEELVRATPAFLTSLFPRAFHSPIMSQSPQISQRMLQFRKRPVVYRPTVAAAVAAAAQRQLSHRNNSLPAGGLTTPCFCNDAGKWKVVNICLCAGQPLQMSRKIVVTAPPTGQDLCLW